MIGRAARGRPWIFREIAHHLRTGGRLPPPSPGWIKAVLLDHLAHLCDFYGEEVATRIARKHIAWYASALPGSARFRAQIHRCQGLREQRRAIDRFFGHIEGCGHQETAPPRVAKNEEPCPTPTRTSP